MSTTLKLSKDASGKSVEQTLYRGMIGSLLYLTASRPDISFSVGVCARYQADPKESHLSSVKRIIRYVNGTSNYGIWYSFDTNASLVGFSDADWAGNCDDRKSTSGGCFFLGNNLVSWFCKKQNSISLSTAEAEYIAAGSGCTKLLWMKQMLVDYGFNQVFGSTNNTKVQQFVDVMSHEFEMSLVGELSYFLGLQIRQMNDGIFITQAKYAKNLVKKFGLENAKRCDTPMSTTLKLSKDASGKSVEQTLYRGMIGSLLYLTASRPNISFSVGVCARYQADPKESHLSSVKRIIRYVNGTSNYGIWYSFDTNASLVGFSDADWAGNCDDRKSTSGSCFFLGNNLVSWFCKKQNSISLSTAEAEYIAAGSGCTQLLWMKQMLVDYGFNQGTLTLFCDNMSAINISKNPVQHSRTKHIDIRHHFIRELVENKCIVLEHVGTNDQLADLFTKPLDATRFKTLSRSIGICLVE
ncbi:hypothetical protein LWI29_036665 [Acer saccharum]|uniref:Reverse transcriptase Ty1/copia-type domain-containing protein n=1 Tax=Acer saccharum TaxID=4024 RepID=A0AA39ST26_ACESA|nr:hypothetical protein LWI29_036665 [Acer saccharum]